MKDVLEKLLQIKLSMPLGRGLQNGPAKHFHEGEAPKLYKKNEFDSREKI